MCQQKGVGETVSQPAQTVQAPVICVVVRNFTVAEPQAVESVVEVNVLPASGTVSPVDLLSQETEVRLRDKIIDPAEVVRARQIY